MQRSATPATAVAARMRTLNEGRLYSGICTILEQGGRHGQPGGTALGGRRGGTDPARPPAVHLRGLPARPVGRPPVRPGRGRRRRRRRRRGRAPEARRLGGRPRGHRGPRPPPAPRRVRRVVPDRGPGGGRTAPAPRRCRAPARRSIARRDGPGGARQHRRHGVGRGHRRARRPDHRRTPCSKRIAACWRGRAWRTMRDGSAPCRTGSAAAPTTPARPSSYRLHPRRSPACWTTCSPSATTTRFLRSPRPPSPTRSSKPFTPSWTATDAPGGC